MIREADIRRVQEWMGHADIQTTMKYLHYESRAEDAQFVARAFQSAYGFTGVPTALAAGTPVTRNSASELLVQSSLFLVAAPQALLKLCVPATRLDMSIESLKQRRVDALILGARDELERGCALVVHA